MSMGSAAQPQDHRNGARAMSGQEEFWQVGHDFLLLYPAALHHTITGPLGNMLGLHLSLLPYELPRHTIPF